MSDLYTSPSDFDYPATLVNKSASSENLKTAVEMLDSFNDHYDAVKASWIFYEVGIFRNGGSG